MMPGLALLDALFANGMSRYRNRFSVYTSLIIRDADELSYRLHSKEILGPRKIRNIFRRGSVGITA